MLVHFVQFLDNIQRSQTVLHAVLAAVHSIRDENVSKIAR